MIGTHETSQSPHLMAFGRPKRAARHSDLKLAQRMLEGDRRAFDEFTDRVVPALYRFASSRLSGDRELTRDLVQTTVCKVLAKLDTYRGDSSLLTWLCSCCRNEIAMHFRKIGNRPRETSLGDEPERVLGAQGAVSPRSERGLLEAESAAWVHTTLDRLPTHYSEALQWKYTERLSVNTIAERLDLTPKAAESLLTRARQTFRREYGQLMQELGFASQDGSELSAVRMSPS